LTFFRFFRHGAAETAAFPGKNVCGIRRDAGAPRKLKLRPT
jgi:hypothetical protein